MRVFQGYGGAVYAAGDPFAFTASPLLDCGDGFTWRSGDESLRCWVDEGPFLFECDVARGWEAVEPLAVRHAAATVAFGRCLSGRRLRCSGVALPTSLFATGEEWRLEQAVVVGKSLSGPTVTNGLTTARLTGVREEEWGGLASVARVLAVLPSAAVGAFVGLGELVRDTSGLKITFDHRGVTYAHG